MAMLTDELLAHIFDGQSHVLAPSLSTWLASSRRFTTFAATFRDKIRKKLRTAQDAESVLDVRLELETAYRLLQDRSLSVVYEPQPPGPTGRLRGPDFEVRFTTNFTFMVEVTRLRADAQSTPAADSESALSRVSERLADTVCGKLGQLLPQHSHVLLVGVEGPRPAPEDLRAALRRIQQRAERNDAAFLHRRRFRDRADFFGHYQRLSEILVRGPQAQAGEPLVVWVNPQAKYPLPSKVRTALYHSQST